MKAGQSKQWLLAAAILFLTVLAYQPVWHAGFIWDDDCYVSENPALRSVDGLRGIWVKPGTTVQYYPLVFTSFWVEYHLWGLQPLGYHLVNVLLHALNAILLWRVLRRLEMRGAWLAAAIFALHPVNVESVAWITERKNVLSGLFYLLAALAWLRFRPLTTREAAHAPDWRFYWLALGLFVCALLSKTVTCSLPAVLLLLAWWKSGRVERRDVLALAPLFVLGVASGLLTTWMEKHSVGASGAEWALSFVQRCLIAGRALWFYAAKLLWPHDLTFVYPRWRVDAGVWWQYTFPLAAVAVVGALWKMRMRVGRGPLVAVLFFAVTLAPALGFFDVFPFRYSYVADHFQYLACIGLIAVGVALVARAATHFRAAAVKAGFGAVILPLLMIFTWRQCRAYADAETVWQDTLRKNPNAWLAHYNLGTALLKAGKLEEAMAHFEEALRIQADYPEAHCNLGVVLQKLGKVTEAKEQYEEAVRVKPDYAEAHYNLGSTLFVLGKITEAIQEYEQAIRIRPDYVAAHSNLGLALARVGKIQEAIDHYKQALRIEPDSAAVHYNLGSALAQSGRPSEAIGEFEQAVRSKPDDAEIHYTLGSALARLGRLPEAIVEWESAVRLKPDFAQAHSDLGLALEQTGKSPEAIGHLEQALRIKPDYPGVQNNLAWLLATVPRADGGDPVRAVTLAQRACELGSNRDPACLDTLGVAYASAGRFDDAIATAQKALELARSANQAELVQGIATRLEMYRRDQAYRE
jgi:tetratricopeptide (TPR) repeat protein